MAVVAACLVRYCKPSPKGSSEGVGWVQII